jgi:hypothetical protein
MHLPLHCGSDREPLSCESLSPEGARLTSLRLADPLEAVRASFIEAVGASFIVPRYPRFAPERLVSPCG